MMPYTFADECQTLHAYVPNLSARDRQFGAILDAPDHKPEDIARTVRRLNGSSRASGLGLRVMDTMSKRSA